MPKMSAAATSLLAKVADIATMRAGPAERAQTLLTSLLRVSPVDAAFISLYDPERQRQVPLMRHGYTAAVNQHLDSSQFTQDLALAGMQSSRAPVRLNDLPVPVETLPSWSEHMYPAGLRQCLGVSLFTFDGRYLGVLNYNSSDPTPASDAACALLARMAPLVAHAVDPLRTVSMTAGIVADAAARLSREQVYATFLCHRDDRGTGAGVVRVTVLACTPVPPGHLRAAVLLSAPPDLRGLTLYELKVTGLLIAGWGNLRIARILAVTTSTVADHVARIMVKLQAASPAIVAVRAQRQGLYIPAELLTAREPTG